MLHRLSVFKKFLLVFTILIDSYTFIAILDLMKDKHSFLNTAVIYFFCLATILFLILILRVPRFEPGKGIQPALARFFYSLVFTSCFIFQNWCSSASG